MKSSLRIVALLLGCLLVSVPCVAAASVSGTWKGTMQQKSDDGQAGKAAIAFHLKQEGRQVSGSAGPTGEEAKPIRDAKLQGDRLTFTVGDAPGPSWKFDLTVSGDTMQCTGEGTSPSGRSMGSTEVSMSRQN
jgi:hypothetical protein